jgi:pyridoxal biosynthesis lyase PdxS
MKDFVLKLIQNGVVAVCEDLNEALEAEDFWASAVLLVSERWGDLDSATAMPNEDLISSAVSQLKIPVFCRVRFGHFWEAEIAQSYWVSAILESVQTEESLEEALNHKDFEAPIISEIQSVEDFKEWQENYLLIW